ncbi:MAG TPA: hypothetical protein VJJ52_08195 [Candidatus Nanoarchaeia archaeon]|nr:hypothetical protein [Candidatus Nanoarchaeia archaeon]
MNNASLDSRLPESSKITALGAIGLSALAGATVYVLLNNAGGSHGGHLEAPSHYSVPKNYL